MGICNDMSTFNIFRHSAPIFTTDIIDKNSIMNNNYIYFLEYTGYEMDDPYYGADFRPIFISLDETKVLELFNKELEASKTKPDFEQEDDESFSYTDGYKWCYRYRIQKLEMDKLIY